MTTPTLKRRSDCYWIVELPDGIPDHGPYDTKAEAESDRAGLARTFRSREWRVALADMEPRSAPAA
jgi:hypothetical protein